jgi:aminoglycoside 2'-N-acetyltransferase I
MAQVLSKFYQNPQRPPTFSGKFAFYTLEMLRISRTLDSDLTTQIESALQSLMSEAFEGEFSEEDWQHTFGGMRFLGYVDNQLIAHGAVIQRWMDVEGERKLVGYVEGIAVTPTLWRKGFGSLLMAELTTYCRSEFPLSMLSTGEKDFYRRHGWSDFAGESYVFNKGVEIRTEDEDEGLMYLLGSSQDNVGPRKVVCESRAGDAW